MKPYLLITASALGLLASESAFSIQVPLGNIDAVQTDFSGVELRPKKIQEIDWHYQPSLVQIGESIRLEIDAALSGPATLAFTELNSENDLLIINGDDYLNTFTKADFSQVPVQVLDGLITLPALPAASYVLHIIADRGDTIYATPALRMHLVNGEATADAIHVLHPANGIEYGEKVGLTEQGERLTGFFGKVLDLETFQLSSQAELDAEVLANTIANVSTDDLVGFEITGQHNYMRHTVGIRTSDRMLRVFDSISGLVLRTESYSDCSDAISAIIRDNGDIDLGTEENCLLKADGRMKKVVADLSFSHYSAAGPYVNRANEWGVFGYVGDDSFFAIQGNDSAQTEMFIADDEPHPTTGFFNDKGSANYYSDDHVIILDRNGTNQDIDLAFADSVTAGQRFTNDDILPMLRIETSSHVSHGVEYDHSGVLLAATYLNQGDDGYLRIELDEPLAAIDADGMTFRPIDASDIAYDGSMWVVVKAVEDLVSPNDVDWSNTGVRYAVKLRLR